MDTQTAACAFRVCWLVSLHAASCRFTSRLLLAAADVLRIGIASLCNEAIDTKTVQNLQVTAFSAAHLHHKHSKRQRPQFNQKNAVFAATLLTQNSTSGPSIFIQAEIDEAIWAPDSRRQ